MHVGLEAALGDKLTAIAKHAATTLHTENVVLLIYAPDAAVPVKIPGRDPQVKQAPLFSVVGTIDKDDPAGILIKLFSDAVSTLDSNNEAAELARLLQEFIERNTDTPVTFNA